MATNWDKVGENAADKTDKELAAGIERLITGDIGKLFPVPADAAKVRALCQQIRVKTAYNERVAAFKAISATLGADLLKAVKAAMLGLVICLIPLSVKAEISPVQETMLNFGQLFKTIRVGYAIDQHGASASIFYTSILTLHTQGGVDLVSFNIGYEGIEKRPTTMIGIRLDNIIPLAVSGDWGKKHVSTSKLPSFEAGPFISFWPKDSSNLWELSVRYGLGAAIG